MIRNILAVIVSIIAWGILWSFAGMALAAAVPDRFDENLITRSPVLLMALIGICSVLCIGAGYLCATIAHAKRMKVVLILGLIQLGIGIFVQSTVWDQMPLWYHLIFLAIVVPMHLLGGKLRTTQSNHTPSLQPA